MEDTAGLNVGTMDKTVVLVHGAHAAAWVWDFVTPALKAKWKALELPGHGARTEPLAQVDLSAAARAIVDGTAGLERIVLVAHSMGVPVALKAADALSGRLDHLVLISGPVPVSGTCVVDNFPLVPRWISKVVLTFQSSEFTQPESVARGSLLNGCPEDKIQFALSRFKNEATRIVLEKFTWSGKPPAPVTYVKCLRDKGALQPPHQDEMARRLNVTPTPLDSCHYPMLEKPAELAAIIDRVAA